MTLTAVKYAENNNFTDFCPLVVNSNPKSSASDRILSENDLGGKQSVIKSHLRNELLRLIQL